MAMIMVIMIIRQNDYNDNEDNDNQTSTLLYGMMYSYLLPKIFTLINIPP